MYSTQDVIVMWIELARAVKHASHGMPSFHIAQYLNSRMLTTTEY